MLKEGDRISNYLLDCRLGAGSFGEVWRARHHVFGDVVAIKIPTDAQYVRNLQREGVAIHGLKHPNIVRAIDLDPFADPPYLIMECVEGPSLREAIDEYSDRLPIGAAVSVIRGILYALTAAHEGRLIHRDIKPANVLLAHPLDQLASITPQAVRVTDFGLGRVGGITAKSIMQSGSMLTDDGRDVAGTVAYMAPEQKEGQAGDERSDLYSCGVVLFEMLTGKRPQGGDLPSSLRRDVPPTLDRVFQGAYTRHEKRYASTQDMLTALNAVDGSGTMVDETVAAATPPPPPRVVPADDAQHRTAARGQTCSACHAAVHRDDQFCIACGQQLVPSVPRCHSCQGYVHPRDQFCIWCGRDLRVLEA